jgi:hypothetical protein
MSDWYDSRRNSMSYRSGRVEWPRRSTELRQVMKARRFVPGFPLRVPSSNTPWVFWSPPVFDSAYEDFKSDMSTPEATAFNARIQKRWPRLLDTAVTPATREAFRPARP